MEVLRNIDKTINVAKFLTIFVLLASFIFAGFIYYDSTLKIEESKNKIYVLNNGNILELTKSRNTENNIEAEIKNHLSMFHEFFFNIDPDPIDIKNRINKALQLIDESGKLLESDRVENRYYYKLIEGSISSRIFIDSIKIDNQANSNKYYVKVFAKQKLERTSKIIMKNLNVDCSIRKVGRSDNNPHGLIIENYQILNNKTIYEKSK